MRLIPTLSLITGFTMSAVPLIAQESFSVGPRHLGMGGAGVAVADDVPAAYYNPAAYGFFAYAAPPAEQSDKGPFSADNNALWRKDFGIAADFTFGARIHKDFADHVNTLKKHYDSGIIDTIGTSGLQNSEANTQALVEVTNALSNLSDPDNAMSIDFNSGIAARIGHFGLGVRVFSQTAGRVNSVDFVNLGIGGAGTLNTQLNGVTASGTGSVMTPEQQNQLSMAGISNTNIATLDALAAQAGIPGDQVQALVDALVIVAGGSGGTIDDNTTSARIYGVGIVEIPLTFGYAFNEHLAIGGNIKGMIGRVYGSDVLIFKDDAEDSLSNARDNYKQTVNFGIDLAVMVRMRLFNFGLTARNINAPTFDGPTVGSITYDDYTLDPSVTAGAAFIPLETVSLTVDLDLTTNKTVLRNYDSQMLRLGGEWDIGRFFAIRGGYSQNLAEDDVGALIHAGLGVNLWAVRIDLAGAMSLDTTTYDGDEIPREFRAAAQLAVDF